MMRSPARTELSGWAGIAALAVAIPLALPATVAGMCGGPPPQPFKATIEACRNPEPEIRIALERHRKFYEDRMAAFPEWMRANKSFDRMVERRVAWPEVIVTLRVKSYSQLSADPKRWEKIRASGKGEKAAPPSLGSTCSAWSPGAANRSPSTRLWISSETSSAAMSGRPATTPACSSCRRCNWFPRNKTFSENGGDR